MNHNVDSSHCEARSLRAGMVASLFMAGSGVIASIASNSDALMVDGLYSAVNFVSALVAAKVARQVQRLPDRRRPLGYDAHEAVYVLFRSLVLVGVLVFAMVSAGGKVIHYLKGGEVPELIFGPILIYTAAMVTICLGLAAWHDHNFKASGGSSDILKTERTASLVDGMLSAGAGGALLMIPYLEGTALGGIIPVADAVVVLILGGVMIGGPIRMLMASVGEALGASVEAEVVEEARVRVRQLLEPLPASFLDIAVTKLGRSHQVVVYIYPDGPIQPDDFDDFREELNESLRELFPVVRAEAIFTRESPIVEDARGDGAT